jgi:RNA recognition motif-containing protein
MNIYVGQLPYNVTEDDLKTMFSEFGALESVKIIPDRTTGRSKGYGFVEMPSNSEADRAIKALNGKMVEGRNIKVIPADSGAKRSKSTKRSFGRNRY